MTLYKINNRRQFYYVYFSSFSQQVFSTPNRRLPLQFSPNNIFCKPAYGDQRTTTGILVKVNIRRPKNKDKAQQIISPTVSIVAMVDTFYEFDCKLSTYNQ